MGSLESVEDPEQRFYEANAAYLEHHLAASQTRRPDCAARHAVKVSGKANGPEGVRGTQVGAIPGLKVNARFQNRMHMEVVGAHPENVRGIGCGTLPSGRKVAVAIVSAKGAGNCDLGGLLERSKMVTVPDSLVYSATGGKMDAPVLSDTMDAAFDVKSEIRVFRRVDQKVPPGDGSHPPKPKPEYIYAGLYAATARWTAKGLGSLVAGPGGDTHDTQIRVLYKLERLSGQDPLEEDCQMHYKGDANKLRMEQYLLSASYHTDTWKSKCAKDICGNCQMNIDAGLVYHCNADDGCPGTVCKACLDVEDVVVLDATENSKWICPVCPSPVGAKQCVSKFGSLVPGTLPIVTPLTTAASQSTSQRISDSDSDNEAHDTAEQVAYPSPGRPQRAAAVTTIKRNRRLALEAFTASPYALYEEHGSGSGKRKAANHSAGPSRKQICPRKHSVHHHEQQQQQQQQQQQCDHDATSAHTSDESLAPTEVLPTPLQPQESQQQQQQQQPQDMPPSGSAIPLPAAAVDEFEGFLLGDPAFVFSLDELDALRPWCESLARRGTLERVGKYVRRASGLPPNAADIIHGMLEKYMLEADGQQS